ncbi:TolC family protein [Phenylobacterium sp.]|uniref:TolC family protein n=1 Tax=Phenylobacterium sp. TaxID=1871053 RepID=UPI0035B3BB25
MKRSLSAALCLALGACAVYRPAPPQLAANVQAYDARRLPERPAAQPWDRASLLAAALERNPAIAAARRSYEAALAAAQAARVRPAATLTLTAEFADEHPQWGYGAGADIPLDAGVRRAARITAADLPALKARYAAAEAMWTVRSDLARAEVELRAARQEDDLASRLAKLQGERAQVLERRVAAGEDARSVQLMAAADAVAAEHRAASARQRLSAAQAALAAATGVPASAVADLALSPDAAEPDLAGLPDWRTQAAVSRLTVLDVVADYDLAENDLRLEVAKQRPEIRLSPAYFYDHGANKLPFNLSLTLPPADLNRAGIRQAEAARAAAGRTLERTQDEVLAGADKAAAALALARAETARWRDRDLPAAVRTAQDAAARFAAGAGDRPDLLAAQAAETNARLGLLDAERVQALARIDLEDALRRSFDPDEAAVLSSADAKLGGSS